VYSLRTWYRRVDIPSILSPGPRSSTCKLGSPFISILTMGFAPSEVRSLTVAMCMPGITAVIVPAEPSRIMYSPVAAADAPATSSDMRTRSFVTSDFISMEMVPELSEVTDIFVVIDQPGVNCAGARDTGAMPAAMTNTAAVLQGSRIMDFSLWVRLHVAAVRTSGQMRSPLLEQAAVILVTLPAILDK
jgi:hypothetical protein